MKSKIGFDSNFFRKKTLILDTSALLKAFVQEDGSSKIEELLALSASYETSIFVPNLQSFEFLNVLGRILDSKEVKESYKLLKKSGVKQVELSSEAYSEAIEMLSANKKISFYDAAYHALAKDFGTYLVTADNKYYQAMRKHGHHLLLA